jgi:hypothetical protein
MSTSHCATAVDTVEGGGVLEYIFSDVPPTHRAHKQRRVVMNELASLRPRRCKTRTNEIFLDTTVDTLMGGIRPRQGLMRVITHGLAATARPLLTKHDVWMHISTHHASRL